MKHSSKRELVEAYTSALNVAKRPLGETEHSITSPQSLGYPGPSKPSGNSPDASSSTETTGNGYAIPATQTKQEEKTLSENFTASELCEKATNVFLSQGVKEGFDSDDRVMAYLALIGTEVSEAVECVRRGQFDTTAIGGKPEGYASELADIVIRTHILAGLTGVDLGAAIRLKHEYNANKRKNLKAEGKCL